MKPLDLKIDWLRSIGYGVEQRGDLLYIYGQDFVRLGSGAIITKNSGRWRVWLLHGNPTYRRLREGLRAHFR